MGGCGREGADRGERGQCPPRALPGDSLAHYLPKSLRDYVAQLFPMPDGIPIGADSGGGAMLNKRLAQAATTRRAGVVVIANGRVYEPEGAGAALAALTL